LILLTHGYFIQEDPKEALIMRPYVPLGLLYISAYLKNKDIAHDVFDTTFSSFEKLTLLIETHKPKLIGIYTNLMTKINVLRIIKYIKENQINTKIILGGPEIRYNAENYLNHGADILVVGEGEETFYDLVSKYLKNGELAYDIHGIAYLKNNNVELTPERVLIKDINTLPFPARESINLKLYGDAWKKHHGYSMYSVSTMRGCPYTCKWCSRAVYGGTYRRRSPKLVVDELEILKQEYQPDRIWFVDDVFTINHKWLREFTAEVIRRNCFIPYEIITRADRMSEEVIDLLKASGCFRIWIGAESGSQTIIDAMDRRVDVKIVREMIIKTKAKGIEAGTFIMLGYPGEKKKHIKETIEHLQAANPDFYTITLAYPITGTPLHSEVKASITTDEPWDKITDRQNQFKRVHSKKFYEYSLQWVMHEVNYAKEPKLFNKVKLKLKALKAQSLMHINA
jgi:anaerobic magnesium-protoporphyrin IX monomethyl ester cyclase